MSMLTLLEVIKKTTDFLASKGVENPRLQSELLVGHALGLKRMQLYLQFERVLNDGELEKIRPMVRRRGLREPIQYIIGETDFFHLTLKTDRRALIPRPETERLLELITVRLAERPPKRILDLGAGSGAIALGLAKFWKETEVLGLEFEAAALELACENSLATALNDRVSFRKSDWFEALSPGSMFDLIVANPPYLAEEELADLEPEVREHEPWRALIGTDNGLGALRTIIRSAAKFLQPEGVFALETGIMQHSELLRLLEHEGYKRVSSEKDYSGRDRFIFAFKD